MFAYDSCSAASGMIGPAPIAPDPPSLDFALPPPFDSAQPLALRRPNLSIKLPTATEWPSLLAMSPRSPALLHPSDTSPTRSFETCFPNMFIGYRQLSPLHPTGAMLLSPARYAYRTLEDTQTPPDPSPPSAVSGCLSPCLLSPRGYLGPAFVPTIVPAPPMPYVFPNGPFRAGDAPWLPAPHVRPQIAPKAQPGPVPAIAEPAGPVFPELVPIKIANDESPTKRSKYAESQIDLQVARDLLVLGNTLAVLEQSAPTNLDMDSTPCSGRYVAGCSPGSSTPTTDDDVLLLPPLINEPSPVTSYRRNRPRRTETETGIKMPPEPSSSHETKSDSQEREISLNAKTRRSKSSSRAPVELSSALRKRSKRKRAPGSMASGRELRPKTIQQTANRGSKRIPNEDMSVSSSSSSSSSFETVRAKRRGSLPRAAPEVWSELQSRALVQIVQGSPSLSWKSISDKLNQEFRSKKTPSQCHQHFRRVADPSIKREPWSAAEDGQLVSLHRSLGGSWSSISRSMPGRPDVHCRRRWQQLCVNRKHTKALQHDDANLETDSAATDGHLSDDESPACGKRPARLFSKSPKLFSYGELLL